jgi:hypothetical protein
MATQLRDEVSAFEVRTCPSPRALGEALERKSRQVEAVLQLRFGEQIAGLAISDLWSACCELLLEAQLVREAKLDHFVLDVEQVFELTYDGDLLRCVFSREHAFAVPRESFAAALEQVVEDIFAATSCPRLMHIAATWSASAIRAQPYSYRFSDSLLT